MLSPALMFLIAVIIINTSIVFLGDMDPSELYPYFFILMFTFPLLLVAIMVDMQVFFEK